MALLRTELRRLTQPSPEMAEVGAEIAGEIAEIAPLSAEARWLQQVDMPPAPCPCPLQRLGCPGSSAEQLTRALPRAAGTVNRAH